MKKCYSFLPAIAIILTLSLASCEIYNPAEQVPSYIRIEKFILNTNNETHGSNSHKITDAWVYVDEQLIGCFELPATIPVLYEGNHHVKIRPGIKVNGISATRSPYPFYTIYEQHVDFKPTAKIPLSPVVEYNSIATMKFIEDFEDVGMNIDDSPSGTDETMEFTSNPAHVFEGSKSGIAELNNTTKTLFECISGTNFILPKGGAPVFLELNYKCNYRFIIGMFAHGSASTVKSAVLGVRESATWNKIYVNLTPTVSGSPEATDFHFFIGILNSEGVDSIGLVIDNIKLVH